MKSKSKAFIELEKLLKKRVVVLDGAMGTMIQRHKLEEEDFRGEEFANHPKDLKGNNDLLSVVRPKIIEDIHYQYMESGSDIIGTNTFNATAIAQLDYGLQDRVHEINFAAAELATRARDQFQKTHKHRVCFVAGAIGPTNKTASLSPHVEDPGARDTNFDELADNYYKQGKSLLEGGADILILETTFDTLNMKAGIFSLRKLSREWHEEFPIMLSVTISDASGRTLSGQTIEAFWNSVRHAKPLSVGMNCALGADAMRPYMEELSNISDCFISCYPNAGLPNPLSETGYDETPAQTSSFLREFVESGITNFVGGCCGTTPDHIKAIKKQVMGVKPRKQSKIKPRMRLSGLEAINIKSKGERPFIMVGERTNVMGSPKFSRLIKEEKFEEALDIARQQVENGANIIDINFDEGLLDSEACMVKFLNLVSAEPDICRVPIMIDSSKWEIIEAGLKCIQGKGIVNSISLKEGEDVFLEHARKVKQYGAAAVVMAFDEKGQAATKADKVRICQRAYKLLTEEVGFDPNDIIFDPNILTVATGMDEHNNYAVDFIEGVREIKATCPGALTSGGVSNVSFSFRGNNVVREAMHSSFLYHAIEAGLDMGIVNAGMLAVYSEIESELLQKVEDVLLNRHSDATENLIEYAERVKGTGKEKKQVDEKWREGTYQEKISHAIVKGIGTYIVEDTEEARLDCPSPLSVIEGPLMDGMKVVGELFGAGKMFLPQVVKSARVMKKSVAYLTPYMDEEKEDGVDNRTTLVMATVKGDVHDIGKNIVAVVVSCNGFNVIDLGVMVSCDEILKVAKEKNADIIGMSGLITPSLDEMISNAKEMQRRGFTIPLLIGGATTSKAHTAIKIAPFYEGPITQVGDASLVVEVCNNLMGSKKDEFVKQQKISQEKMRELHGKGNINKAKLLNLSDARANRFNCDWDSVFMHKPNKIGTQKMKFDVSEIIPYIDWSPFFWTWELKGLYPKILSHKKYGEQATIIFADAQKILNDIVRKKIWTGKAVFSFWPAHSEGDDVHIFDEDANPLHTFHFLRQQKEKTEEAPYYCLSDFIAPKGSKRTDYLGAFAVTMGNEVDKYASAFQEQGDDYTSIMVKAIGDRLAEALAELLHKKVRLLSGYGSEEQLNVEGLVKEEYQGIRPAPGYPACPDHTEKTGIWSLLDVEEKIGATLTENFAMNPAPSVSGFYFSHSNSKYFTVGKLGEDQIIDYAKRKNMTKEVVEKWLSPYLDYNI